MGFLRQERKRRRSLGSQEITEDMERKQGVQDEREVTPWDVIDLIDRRLIEMSLFKS